MIINQLLAIDDWLSHMITLLYRKRGEYKSA